MCVLVSSIQHKKTLKLEKIMLGLEVNIVYITSIIGINDHEN